MSPDRYPRTWGAGAFETVQHTCEHIKQREIIHELRQNTHTHTCHSILAQTNDSVAQVHSTGSNRHFRPEKITDYRKTVTAYLDFAASCPRKS